MNERWEGTRRVQKVAGTGKHAMVAAEAADRVLHGGDAGAC